MQIRIIKSTDGHFCGQVLSGSTIEEAVLPLVERMGESAETIIKDKKITLRTSNYMVVAMIMNEVK